jgi:hypothetical protein
LQRGRDRPRASWRQEAPVPATRRERPWVSRGHSRTSRHRDQRL